MNEFALLQCQLVPQKNLLDSVKKHYNKMYSILNQKHRAIPVVHNQGKEKERFFPQHCPSPDFNQ